jgi:hypothetical protein
LIPVPQIEAFRRRLQVSVDHLTLNQFIAVDMNLSPKTFARVGQGW